MPETPYEMDILRFLPLPRIIAVDNRPDHLELIKKGLFRLGLPCIPILYDAVEGLEKPERWNARRLRVVFLDLNLSEIENPGGDLSMVVGTIVGHINYVLHDLAPDGPYLIIFWTEHKDWVDDTMRYLAEREKNTPLPIGFTALDKAPFIPIDGEHNLADLEQAIIAALSKHRLFLAMLAWESEVEGAAVSTFNKVHSLVKKGQPDGTAQKDEDLQDITKSLAMAAWGKTNAIKDPGAAIASGLAPVLLDHLDSIMGDEDYTHIWEAAISGEWNDKLPEGVSPASLNAHCLVDLNCQNRRFRGTWLEFSQETFSQGPHYQLCLRGASKSWGPTGAKLARRHRYGRTTQTYVVRRSHSKPDFQGNGGRRGQRVQWVKRDQLRPFQECFDKTKNELVGEFIKPKPAADVGLMRNSVHLGILDFTAACDYNNDNAPLRRFVLCARIPEAIWKARKQDKLSEAIYPVGLIAMEEGEFYLFLNFRYGFSLPDNHSLLTTAEPIFRVRSQVLTDIADRYAAHTTRVGTLSFGKKR